MSRLGPAGLTQLLTDIKTWITTKLGNYVTTDTTQTVTGKKYFTNSTTQVNSVNTFTGSTLFIDTSASAPRGSFPESAYRVGRIYIGDGTSYNGSWFIIDPTIDTNRAYYRMVTTNPDNTDSTRFTIEWNGTLEGVRRRRNISMGDLLPSGNNTYNLGADDLKWDIGYIHNLIGSNKEDLTEDANSYYSTTSGSHMTFYTTSNGGTKLSNVPAAVNTHLESRTIRYLSSSDWIVEQICHNSFGLYYRKGTNGTWEDWKTFAFTDSNITGTAANVTGTVAIANGGTGATTRLNAVKNLTNESVGTPTHFLAITTNWGKAGYTTVAQAKTVLGITGDMGSHSDSEYVHKTGDESISGAKTFSNNITINGTYLGTEASTNERTNIYLLANRDTAGTSGAYISRFRQNRTQGAMGSSDVSFISFDFLENSTRYTRCFTMGLTDWDSDGVPQTYWLSSSAGKGSLGTASTPWNKVYATNYYLGSTAFGDIVTHNASEFLTSHQSLSSCVKNVVTNNQTIKSTGITRGTAPSSAQTFGIAFNDNNDKYIGNIYGQYATDKSTYVGLYAYKGTTTANSDNVSVRVGYDASGNAYTYAPTPATADNSTKIATTAFVKAQGYLTSHQSLANYALDANVVHTSGDETIAGKKSFNAMPSILGSYLGNEYSTNARTCLYLKSNRDTDGQSGIYFSKFRQNVAQGALTGSNLVDLSLDVLENSVRTNSCISISFRYFENDVPTKIYVIPKASVTSYMGTANNPWTSIYGTNIYGSFTGNLTGDVTGNASSATEFSANKDVTLTGDVTGTASSKAGWSVATTLANSGVTAGDYGPSEDASPSHSGTFTVPSITVDAKGRITAASTKTITLPADSNTDTKVTQTVTTANSGYPVLLCATANATATGTTTSRFSAGLTVNTRYSSIYITNKYDTANTKGVRNTSSYNNGILYFRSYDATQMGLIRCDSHKSGYQHIYMQATNYIKNGAIDPEGTATTCSIAVRVRDNGSKTIYTEGSWENSLTPYEDNTHSLGTQNLKWKNIYANNYYKGTTAFGDIVTHNASEFLTSADLLPIGSYIQFAGSQAPDGFLVCNGGEISRTTYSALFAVIGTTYGSGDGSTTFNLPDLTDRFLQGSSTSGTVKDAGLPNITGSIRLGQTDIATYGASQAGAFGVGGGKIDTMGKHTTDNRGTTNPILFDASSSNSIYGNSSTVQPPALTCLICIKY